MKVIKDERSYQIAIRRLDEVFGAPKGTPEYDEAELLELLIENYENENYPIDSPDPIQAIEYLMKENDWKQSDLIGILGDKSKVSLVLNRKRKLSLSMIRNLSNKFQLPAEILIKDYSLTE